MSTRCLFPFAFRLSPFAFRLFPFVFRLSSFAFRLFFFLYPLCALCVFCGESSSAGPRVEITPSDGRPAYTCCLLGYKGGVLHVQLESGEMRQESDTVAKSIRFLPPVEAAAPAPPQSAGPKHGEGAGRWPALSLDERRRLAELDQHEANGTLTPIEAMELLKLRERAPPPLRRWEATRRKIIAEGGKVDIAAEQRRLRDATQEDEAGEAVRRLVWAYLQQGYTGPKLKELLQKDVESISAPDLRKKLAEHIDPMTNWFGARGPARKDK